MKTKLGVRLGVSVAGMVLAACVARGVPIVTDQFTGTEHHGFSSINVGVPVGASDGVYAFTNDVSQMLMVGNFEATTPGAGAGQSSVLGYNGGNWASSLAESIRLDFDTTTYTPLSLSLYFQDSSQAGSYWYYDFPIVSGGWNTYTAFLDYSYGTHWYRLGGSPDDEASFLSALASVDLVGIEITYQQFTVGQYYAFDNLLLDDEPQFPAGPGNPANIPEPGSYVVLGTVLLSMVTTFRKRIKTMLP